MRTPEKTDPGESAAPTSSSLGRRRGRPPSRPFLRELAAFRRLVRLPTRAAALTKATDGLRDWYDLAVATLTLASVGEANAPTARASVAVTQWIAQLKPRVVRQSIARHVATHRGSICGRPVQRIRFT